MEKLEPMERGGNQETLHFAAPKIVDEGVPVLIRGDARHLAKQRAFAVHHFVVRERGKIKFSEKA